MVKVITDENQIKEIFGRYAQAVFPSSEKALEVFKSGRRLTFYLGIDPTGPDIHLGHVTNFLVLKKIINLGHKVILLIGDFTARIGDPTGKDTARQPLSKDQVKENMKTYLSQVYKILPKGSVEIKYNSQWLEKMNLEKVIALESYFTVQQMMARDMFEKRLQEGENPKNLKEELAFEIVRMVYGEKEAGKVKEEFKKVFSESELPSELEEFEVGFGSTSLVLLLSEWLKVSKSEAKRLVEQKAVKVNDKIAESWDYEVKSGDIIKAGPRNFVRVT